MKILRIIYDWPPPWTGLAPHPYELTKAQSEMGHEVDVLCGRWPNAGNLEVLKDVNIHTIIREPFEGAIFFTSSVICFFKYLSMRKKKSYDVIHSHGHFGIWIYFYRLFLQNFIPWSKELKTPLVVHFHNVAQDRWDEFIKQKKFIKPISKYIVWPLTVFSDKKAIKTGAACIFVSDNNRLKAIELYGATKERCFVEETGVNPLIFKPVGQEEKDKSRADLGFDTYDKVILNHGAMVERKNIHLLVDVLKLLPVNYKLLLAGDGDAVYMSKIDEKIKLLGLTDRIIRVGYTPYPQVPIAYQMSDIFVLPSSWEGLPKVVMQGLSCGISCLVSGFKLSKEVRGLYYLKNFEPLVIAQQIQGIVENNQPVDRNYVAINYSWSKVARDIDRIYEFSKQNYLL